MDSTQHTNNRPLVNLTFLNITMQPSLHQVSDIDDDTMLHKTAVLVIMSILIFISASLSGAVLVFCKKKNSVFIYQKSEPVEKDYEYEMDDIHTEIDSSEIDNEPIRSQTYPMMAAIPKPTTDPKKVIVNPMLKKIRWILLCCMPIVIKIAISRRFCWIWIKSNEIIFILATSVMR